ncbi:Uncharacterized protein TCM_012724 [Theobroma cacao]|uniref:Uncharacterized protein n=1 Tax=Theobroma cacao TaxID=3641 RepID=A0A061FVN2_THECC|nr:Uncharacterized protein TCM_012724 [Theobroma cacao]
MWRLKEGGYDEFVELGAWLVSYIYTSICRDGELDKLAKDRVLREIELLHVLRCCCKSKEFIEVNTWSLLEVGSSNSCVDTPF